MQHRTFRLALILFAVTVTTVTAWAFSSGPVDGVTGAPGELTCAQIGCHNSFPLNSGPGNLSITFSPPVFQPGDTLDISVNLSQSGQSRWGFEATVLDHLGLPVGQILVTDPVRTQTSTALSGKTYIKHTLAGTDAGSANAAPGWSFKWIAPPVATDISAVFWVAGNAANGNFLSSGDFIYTDSISANYVQECSLTTGDANSNAGVTSSDIIYLVGYVFRGGPAPLPCAAVGDVNCDGVITASDVIFLVGYVFKGGQQPCDVCLLVPGTWTCP